MNAHTTNGYPVHFSRVTCSTAQYVGEQYFINGVQVTRLQYYKAQRANPNGDTGICFKRVSIYK